MKRVKDEVKSVREIPVGAAININLDWTKPTMGVDWLEWVKNNYIDFISPMIYHRDYGQDVSWVFFKAGEIIKTVEGVNPQVIIIVSVGGSLANTGKMSGSEWIECVERAAAAGSKTVFIFADVCIEEAKAWDSIEKMRKE